MTQTHPILLSDADKTRLVEKYKVSSIKQLNKELEILAGIQTVDIVFAERCYSKANGCVQMGMDKYENDKAKLEAEA